MIFRFHLLQIPQQRFDHPVGIVTGAGQAEVEVGKMQPFNGLRLGSGFSLSLAHGFEPFFRFSVCGR
jgi:hypothetical protein